MLMCINLIITLFHFLNLQYSVKSNDLVLPAKVASQGLDLPSCLKQQKHQTKYMKQWISRHWISGNEGQGSCETGDQLHPQFSCLGRVTGHVQGRGDPAEPDGSWVGRTELRVQENHGGRSSHIRMVEKRGLHRKKTPEMYRQSR